jgi:hypothetical protein
MKCGTYNLHKMDCRRHKLNYFNSMVILCGEELTAMGVGYCKGVQYSGKLHTNFYFILKIFNMSFSLHSQSVTVVTSSCSLSLLNCDTAHSANSVSLKDLIYRCIPLYIDAISNNRPHSASEDSSLKTFSPVVQLNSSSSFCVITVSTVQL